MLNNKIDYCNDILDIVSNDDRPIPVGVILKKLANKKNIITKLFFKNIDQLILSCQLIKLKNGKIVLGYPKAEVDFTKKFLGTISINDKLSGFIKLLNQTKTQYFVHKTNLNGALDGDVVEFALLKIKNDPTKILKDAIVLNIKKHVKTCFVGTYFINDHKYSILADDKKMYLPIKLIDNQNLVSGCKILMEIIKFDKHEVLAKVNKIIGLVTDKSVDVLSIIYDNGIQPDFPQDVLQEAKAISSDISFNERLKRTDITNLPLVTIDPSDSNDYDDAICCIQLSNKQYRLVVAIADVSYFVKPNSKIEQEAIKRGCSIYLVDRVIPMLPHNLCDQICSFLPGRERMSLTIDMIIDDNGEFVSTKIYPSIIKSYRRFTYDEVNAYFNKESPLANDPQEIKNMLDHALHLHNIFSKMKTKRGYIKLDIPQLKFIIDKNGQPIETKLQEHGLAQEMIESFMVATNEAVTMYIKKFSLPFIYRVHTKPKDDKLQFFLNQIKTMNCENVQINKDNPLSFANFLLANKNNSNIAIINYLLLHTLAKAEYSTHNIGHFGLASKNYTHFTAPIRRFADVVVHRLLRMFILDKKNYSDTQRSMYVNKLNDFCSISNNTELLSITIEQQVEALKSAQYMQKHIGEKFLSTVVSVTRYGVFVQLPNLIDGFIKLSNLKDDFYNYDDVNSQFIGKRSRKIIAIGTRLYVQCISANPIDRKIEFVVINGNI